jgi:hypothetical protein
MDSPARRYMFDGSGFVDTDSNETGPNHTNWEGLITALGISAVGWAALALLIVRFLR